MTTAFLAEVDTPEGTRYIAMKGKLSKVPFFFASSLRLKTIFETKPRYLYDGYYDLDKQREATRVCVVMDVEKGLRASTGANMSVASFMSHNYSSTDKYAPKKPRNAVFKIRVRHGTAHRYAGGGKFGRTWERQGDLRLHITNNLSRLTVDRSESQGPYYKDAEVVMIELAANGITPTNVTYTPLLDFYLESPNCKKRWSELTRTSLSNTPILPDGSRFL